MSKAWEPARCGNCKHWHPRPWVNRKMYEEAVKNACRTGDCDNPKADHHITAEQFHCDQYRPLETTKT